MSVINRDKKYIFIHIPKTAGTSMEKYLQPVYHRHKNIAYYEKYAHLTETDISRYFRFAFVRNPYERFASGVLGHPLRGSATRQKFNDFIRNNEHNFMNWDVTRPAKWFLCYNGKLAVDFVGRFETLEDDWARVCDTIGIGAPLEHTNQAPHSKDGRMGPPYEQLYDPDTKEIVREWLKKDFEMFGYKE